MAHSFGDKSQGPAACGSSSEIAQAKGVCASWEPGRRGSKHGALRVLSGGFPTESRGPPHAGPGGQHPGNTCWRHQKQPAKENVSLSSRGLQREQGQQETCKGPRKSSHERKNSWNICQAQKAWNQPNLKLSQLGSFDFHLGLRVLISEMSFVCD